MVQTINSKQGKHRDGEIALETCQQYAPIVDKNMK